MKSGSIPAESIPSSRRLYSCFLCLTSRRLKDKRIKRWKVLTTFVRALNPRRQPNKYPTRNARTVSNRQQPIKERKSSFMCGYVFFQAPWPFVDSFMRPYWNPKQKSCTRTRWHQQQMPVGCAVVHPIVNWRARRAERIIPFIPPHRYSQSYPFHHFSKRIKSSRLQSKFGGNIETNNRVINVVTYPNGYKRRLAIYEIIQLITDRTPKNIFHDRSYLL